MSRFVAQWLVVMLALGSMLLAPPVMAWTMSPMTQMTTSMQSGTIDAADCLLCQQQSSNQHQQSANPMPDCPMAACSGIATVGTSTVTGVAFDTAILSTSYTPHFGRLVPGPEPHPPRSLHSN